MKSRRSTVLANLRGHAAQALLAALVICPCLALGMLWRKLSFGWSGFVPAALISVILVSGFALGFPWMRRLAGDRIEALRYGRTYASRRQLLSFVEYSRSSIDLERIAPPLLSLLAKTMEAKQIVLLLPEEEGFTSRYCERDLKYGLAKPVTLRKDGGVVSRLEQGGRLDLESFAREIRRAQDEIAPLREAEVRLLLPLKNQGRLVAILGLSSRNDGGAYSGGELDLVTKVCDSSAAHIENAILYARARERANTDELTGLFNRSFFERRLDEEIARSSRYGEVFSLIMIDVDNFKRCNDESGHLVGDEVLKKISNFARIMIRNSDICFRYGGDEFTILLPRTPLEGASVVAERVRKGVESLMDLSACPVTVSIGISSWPTDGVMKEDIIRSADAALYHSKQTGKNRINLACQVALSHVFRIEAAAGNSETDSLAQLKVIHTLAANVDAKDPNTEGHALKVSAYATRIAQALGFAPDDVERIKTAGLLHDIGKIGIPEQVLKKNGPLTADEREIIQAHPNLAVSIIEHVDSLRDCLAGIQYHHERFNGGGYPSGLKGSNVPLDARILAVADSFDAMTSPRPYRKTLTREEALQELKACSGTQFDPQVVEVFVNLNDLESVAGLVVPDARRVPVRSLFEYDEPQD